MATTKKTMATPTSSDIYSALPLATPGGPIDIVFSFDTTASMNGCIAEVRKQVQKVITRLFTDIPNLRVAVFAHGDYDTAHIAYVTKYVDFTNDCNKLCNFVENVKSTAGGKDWPECYELVLKQVREELSWNFGSQRSLVMIGDSYPHEPSYRLNKDNIDWRKETDRLIRELGLQIYAVQCGRSYCEEDANAAASFYETLAEKTHGKHLKLEQFSTIVDTIMGICYREHGAEFYSAYENEVRDREGEAIRAELDKMLLTLRDPKKTTSDDDTSPESGATAVMPPSVIPKTKKVENKGEITKRGLKRKADTPSSAVTTVKKTRMDGTRVFPREKEVSSYFAMNDLAWSPWRPILSSSKPKSGKWSKTRKHYNSYRNKEAFSAASSGPAVWEFAVQHKRNIPVFCKVTDSYNPARKSCDVHLLNHPNIRDQTERVISDGCQILARRASFKKGAKFNETPVKSTTELRKLIKDTYDYAWSSDNTTGRNVQRGTVCISKDLSD